MQISYTLLSLVLLLNTFANCQTIKKDESMSEKKYSIATFGGGCFWCTEAIFERIDGVISATSGYSGGEKENPTYDEVCSEATGHAEVIHVEYNPQIISYTALLEIFFKTHDPTTLNRQGVDIGTQYRSVVLYHTNEQKEIVEATIKELDSAEIWKESIVTEVKAFDVFYSAEAHHQEYFENNSKQMYCQMTIVPKIEKFEKIFKDKLKK